MAEFVRSAASGDAVPGVARGMQQSCPVKASCTSSDGGREISREIDPWPHSGAGRFHRGIACAVASFGVVLPLATLIANHSLAEVLVLTGTVAVVLLLGWPLARHLWNTPSNAPEHLPHRTAQELPEHPLYTESAAGSEAPAAD